MRFHTETTYNQDGTVLESKQIPWTISDYVAFIAFAERQITPRRMREASLNVDGAIEWLSSKNKEIEELRQEMLTLTNEP
jgi:hypothetical protein